MPTRIESGERAHHQRLAEFGVLGVLGVEVDRMRVHGEQREPGVVGLADGAAGAVRVGRAHLEVLVVVPARHAGLRYLSGQLYNRLRWTPRFRSRVPLRPRILAVEQYGAGPAGSVYLADLGAEVIKVENLREGGDVGRDVGPHFFGPRDSQFFQTFNRNKRSIALDLRSDGGRAVFRDLARDAPMACSTTCAATSPPRSASPTTRCAT